MKYLSAIIAILVACLMAGSALAVQHEGGQQGQGRPQTEYTLLAHSDDGGFFTLEEQQDQQQQDQQQQDQQQQDQQQQDQQQQDQQQQDQQQQDQQQGQQQDQNQTQGEQNPTLVVPPGEEIMITLRAADSMGEHNFCVDMGQQQQDQQQQDQQQQDQQQQDQQQQDQQQQDQQQQDQQQQDQQQQEPECSESVSQEGDEVEFNFTVPDSGQTGQESGENQTGGGQTYRYFSEFSPGMEGQIVVQEDEGMDPFDPEDPEQQPEGEEEPTPGPALIGLLAVLGFAGLFAARRRGN